MTTGKSNDIAGQRRIGKWMLIIGWLAFIILLTWLFQSVLHEQFNPNSEVSTFSVEGGAREIVLERNRDGHYVATGMINNREVVFLLDTGATLVAVPEQLADQLGLTRGVPSVSRTANGNVQVWSTILDVVSLGGIVQTDVRATILPNMSGNEILLGMSFLKHLELVQRGNELRLRQY